MAPDLTFDRPSGHHHPWPAGPGTAEMPPAGQQDYQTFELLVGARAADGYPVTITQAPAGEAGGACRLDPTFYAYFLGQGPLQDRPENRCAEALLDQSLHFGGIEWGDLGLRGLEFAGKQYR